MPSPDLNYGRRKGRGQYREGLLLWEIVILFCFQSWEGRRQMCLAFQLQASLCHPACVSPGSELFFQILKLVLSIAVTVRKHVSWGGGGIRKHTFKVFSIFPVVCNSYLSLRCFF
ncbi:unnamed protein product [Rangifer tarandus platyrhynchus]|uniref:Uncharacterized protein n=1 Tax=Rangifer tarandus platyrhynchus TaxID=3082113 RepID=A0ABN8YPU8_RANTA|nr:unnamed protein product [Rangifer tarandus platyrhynchus]